MTVLHGNEILGMKETIHRDKIPLLHKFSSSVYYTVKKVRLIETIF